MAQELLRDSWLRGQHGRLCAWEQAKALALREASRELHGRTQLAWIAARVERVGGGHPSGGALHKFFKVVDGDKEWFPGKQRGAARGPRPLLARAKRRCIARSAMAAKKLRGDEPCVTAVVHACPRATTSPRTGKPFCDKTIRKVFTEDSYDFDPEHQWKFQHPLQKVFLSAEVKQHRAAMAEHLLQSEPSAAWWAQQVVWLDLC